MALRLPRGSSRDWDTEGCDFFLDSRVHDECYRKPAPAFRCDHFERFSKSLHKSIRTVQPLLRRTRPVAITRG